MERVLIVLAVVVLAAGVSVVVRRRRPEPPTQGRWPVPTQLDRVDFDRPDAPWLVVVFSSTTCLSCADAVEKAAVLAGAEVGRLVDTAFGSAVHGEDGEKAVPHFAPTDDRPGSPDREAFPDPAGAADDVGNGHAPAEVTQELPR